MCWSDLQRFVKAQEPVFDAVLREIRAGEKQSHWMWFVFPQLLGLGRSPMAQRYGIRGLPKARAYLSDPVLGPRLLECVEALLAVSGRTLQEIFGSPDDIKFRSSMTLFALASENGSPFQRALDRYCGGQMDPATLDRLNRRSGPS